MEDGGEQAFGFDVVMCKAVQTYIQVKNSFKNMFGYILEQKTR